MTTYTWKNNSGSYSDNSQWTDDQGNNPSGPPGAGDTAEMAGGDVTGSGAAEDLDVSGTMTFDAALTVTNLISNGDVTIDSQTITAETASMNGTLDLLGELDVTGYAAGMYGTLDLTVENGGKLSVTKLTLGNGSTLEIDKGGEIDASGGQNSVPANGPVGVVVNGTGSVDGGTLNSSGGWIAVGEFGNGTLDAKNGATITSTYGSIGSFSGDTGAVTLEGSGTVWRLNGAGRGDIGIGSGGSPGPAGGSGSLTISAGASVLASSVGYVGFFSGSTGDVSVTGSGSLFSFGTALIVGDQGTGTFKVADQGKVTIGTYAVVANQSGGTGDMTLDGGATATIAQSLFIGNNGNSDGKVSLDGDGTTLTVGNSIEVGEFGTGSFKASNNAVITVHSSGGFGLDVGYGNGGDGTLDLSSGAHLTDDAFASIGTFAGSTGTVTIDGSDTLWHQGTTIVVGFGGTGSVTIENEGAAEADGLISGLQGSSTGDELSITTAGTLTVNSADLSLADGTDTIATVDGSGSLWTINGALTVGGSGDAILTIQDQGEVDADSVTIASQATSAASEIDVDGQGSLLEVGGDIDIGLFGIGSASITDGGVIDADNVFLGLLDDSQGDLTVDGEGSTLAVAQLFVVGLYGNATVEISNGGEIDDTAAYLGDLGDASDGEATVEGDGSLWTTTNELVVGNTGFGSVLVQSGGEVDADSLTVGGGPASGTAEDPDSVTVTGKGSRLQIASALVVGFNGFGALSLADGAQMSFSGLTIRLGADAGGSGVFTISNTDLDFAGQLIVGDGGDGTVNIQDGASVTVDTLDIAAQSTSGSQDTPSVVTVSGAGSSLTVNDELIVGVNGYGTLEVTDGGTLSYAGDQLIVGDQADGVGEFDITGTGQSLTLDTTLIVGNAGIGTVNVDPIHLFLQVLHLGEQAGAQGIFNVTGQGSVVTVAQEVIVGNAGAGEVHVRDGAAFESNGELTIGSQDGSTGTIEVSGDDSTWTTSGDDTTFGDAGDGTLDVNAGGTFDASFSSVTFASQDGSTGSLTITGDGSSVTAFALTFGDSGTATGTIEDGGGLTVSGDLALGEGDGGSGNLTVAGGDLTVGGNLTIGGAGTGILVSQGGAITVQGPEINIGDEASGTGTFTINTADASLDFSGEITVGAAGNGAMFVQLGADITVDAVTVADQTGSTGSLTVDSDTTVLQTGDLTIGSSGQGTLDVKNGANLISTGEGKIADLVAGVISSATVEAGGIWALNGDLTVGGSGIGTLSVNDATVSTLSSVTIGDLAVSSGFVTVTGSVTNPEAGTSPSSLGWGEVLTVGNDGYGTLSVEDGALVESIPGGAGEVDIAAHDGSTGSITVDGVNSLLGASDLVVGGTLLTQGGVGTLTAQHGGSVAVTDTVTLWDGNVDVADDGPW